MKKGQGSLEYMMMIIIVLAAFITMGYYLKRGMQGRLKREADYTATSPYDPFLDNSEKNVSSKTLTVEVLKTDWVDGKIVSTKSANTVSNVSISGYESYGGYAP